MSTRLAQVMCAGQARRSCARTGAHELADFDDDLLRLITDAIGNGEAEAACRAVKNWCALNKRHRTMGQEGGDALWNGLTRRVFGEDKIGTADPNNTQTNFYELGRLLIRHKAAARWLTARHPGKSMNAVLEDEDLLLDIGAVLEYKDHNALSTPGSRMTLVRMLIGIVCNQSDYDTRNEDLLALYSLDQLYKTLQSEDEGEVDKSLEFLHLLANDYILDDDDDIDSRMGYDVESIFTLQDLLRIAIYTSRNCRVEKILGIWRGLLSDEVINEDDDRINNMGKYARAMIAHGADAFLLRSVVDSPNLRVRIECATILKYIGRALNDSLSTAMHDVDAGEADEPARMTLTWGVD